MNNKNAKIKPVSHFINLVVFTKTFLLKMSETIVESVNNHKNSTRVKLAVRPINFVTLTSLLPFIIGFYGFLNQKYPFHRKYLFFEKNLPNLSVPTEKIDWETFQYIIEKENIVFSQDAKFSWSDKDFIIEIPVEKAFIKDVDSNLISSISSSKSKLKHYLITLNSTPNLSLNQKLDEIPKRLQGIYKNNPLQTRIDISYPIKNIPKNIINQDYLFQEYTPKSNFLLGVKINSSVTKSDSSKLNISDSSNKFYKKEEFFTRELRTLFNNTNLIPNFDLFSKPEIDKFLKIDFSKNSDIKFLQEVIRETDKLYAPKPTFLNRLMSGYLYPDMNLKQVISLYFKEQNAQKRNIKLIMPSSFLIPNRLKTLNEELPTFTINSKKIVLFDSISQSTNLYEGPSIILKTENGLDWQVHLKKSAQNKSLREYMEFYLNSKNSLTDSLKNFFGIFESLENNQNSKFKINLLNKNYWFNNLPIFRIGNIANTTPSFFEFTRSFQLPYLTNEQWEVLVSKQNELKGLNLNTISLPIIETRFPKKISPQFLFGYKYSSELDFSNPLNIFKNSKVVTTSINPDLELTFQPGSTNYLNNESFENSLTSGIYKKTPSILDKNLAPIFYDLWEPLTFKSWLVTSQIGFAFLIFTILKALADNYGRELLVYLLDLVALLGFLDDDLKQEIEILMGQREKGFRIISKTTKNFSNIGGIENLLPEIIEIVWFLRNSGREFSISKTLPRGILLSGPPGTGKTLLVQAIAGEAEVPVLALSGSSLVEPGESGALKLEILFQEARRLAPCIVFIDEMDTLAEKREQVLQNPMGADEILESLSNTRIGDIIKKSAISENGEESSNEVSAQQDMQKEKLRILMQFLVELDGIQGRDGVVVIGATNRPEMLDAAILRPGRFDRVLELGLPGPEKRKEILKLYSNNLGIDKSFSWSYLIHRTAGYSAADLASIMNQSTLNAIIRKTSHTIETIEYGIDRITTIGIEKPFSPNSPKLSTIQLAYYQAGKILLSLLLEHHPPTLVTHLWPRRTNIRALQISKNLQKYFFRFARRIELEHRIIGCYGGKAAEILFLQNSSLLENMSDLGIEDIQFGQNLIMLMTDYWYLYGKKISLEKNLNILETANTKEYQDNSEKISFFNAISDNFELSSTDFSSTDLYPHSTKQIENKIEQQAQKYFSVANWQYDVSDEFEMATRTFSDWYRLYLPDPQQSERNLEWIPPDEFYHSNQLLNELTDSIHWNMLSEIHVDYEKHSMILQSFNKAMTILDQHREVLDKLAYELINREILREPEIQSILKNFNIDSRKLSDDFQNNSPIKTQIINPTWGKTSRRSKNRTLNLELIQNN